ATAAGSRATSPLPSAASRARPARRGPAIRSAPGRAGTRRTRSRTGGPGGETWVGNWEQEPRFYHEPVKRAVELHPLSREHHDGLIVARRLRRAAEGSESLPDAVAAFLRAWRGPLAAHFRAEEEILLPRLAEVAGEDDPLIVRVLVDHREVA